METVLAGWGWRSTLQHCIPLLCWVTAGLSGARVDKTLGVLIALAVLTFIGRRQELMLPNE